jgi:predicted Fe-Mo cluster-binding NifX family protein
MKIAISAQGTDRSAAVDPRFGRCKWFLVFDTDSEEIEVVDNDQSTGLAHGAGIQSAKLVIDRGARVVLTGGCGPKAFDTLDAAGVRVVTGVGGTVGDAIDRYRSGAGA